jgi:hypothetical protein
MVRPFAELGSDLPPERRAPARCWSPGRQRLIHSAYQALCGLGCYERWGVRSGESEHLRPGQDCWPRPLTAQARHQPAGGVPTLPHDPQVGAVLEQAAALPHEHDAPPRRIEWRPPRRAANLELRGRSPARNNKMRRSRTSSLSSRFGFRITSVSSSIWSASERLMTGPGSSAGHGRAGRRRRDPDQAPPLFLHRGPVIIPVRMLAGDRAVVLD